MDQETITTFWNTHPCGDSLVDEIYAADYEEFFAAYDAYRFQVEGHILRRLDAIDWNGKRVLEIGLGQGADAEQIIHRGGIWNGVDATEEAVNRTRTRLELRRLPYEQITVADVNQLPGDLGLFDIVYSHGVLHHVPTIHQAQYQIHQHLRETGRLIAMLYARWSLNYVVAIGAVRRLGLLAAALGDRFGWTPPDVVAQHLENARQYGWRSYLRNPTWTSRNTDGPSNPYSVVYDLNRVRNAFPSFAVDKSWREFMHAPPLPVHGLPGASFAGWHLWVDLRPLRDAVVASPTAD